MNSSNVQAWCRSLLGALGTLVCLEGGWACAAGTLALDPARPLKQYSLDVWTSADGLPQNSVYAISQTPDGYLWLGTQEGLVRFDGLHFSVFDSANTPALANPNVGVLVRGWDDELWIGTESGRLVRFANGAFEAFAPAAGQPTPSITALVQVAPGRLWVGTAEGLSELRDGRLATVEDPQLPKGAVRALYADHRGVLWIGTDAGLRQGSRTYTARDGLAGDRITAITEDAQGDLWVGTTAGLSRRTQQGFVSYGTREGLPANWVRSLLVDRQGAVWVATERGLARHWQGRFDGLTDREGLSRPSITTVFEDRDGSLWAGTNGGGLNRLQTGPILTYSVRHGLSDEVVYALSDDGADGLWVGTIRGGVSHFRNGVFGPFPVPNPFAAGSIRSLHHDPAQGLWVGTDLGLYRYTGGRLVACPAQQGFPDRPVRTILRDAEGTTWFGTDGGGLTGWRDGRFVHYGAAEGLPSDRVRTLARARGGGLWVGTSGGVARMKDGRFETWSDRQGLSSNLVRALHEDEAGVLWIGTFGGGLNRLEQGRISAYRQRDGLFSDVVYHIAEDGRGHLWMSCNKGIFRIAKQQLEEFRAGHTKVLRSVGYDESAGMLSRECNSGSAAGWQTSDGYLWFPTLKGLVRVSPQALAEASVQPAAVVERVLVDDTVVDHPRESSFPPGRQRLELAYTAPAFLHARGLRFRFRLEGFDREWREAGTRRAAFYTNLPPGGYTFRVATVSPDSTQTGQEASYRFQLEPYFHQTRAFFGLCLLLGVLVVGGLYAWRVRHLKTRQKHLAVRVEEALASLKMLRGLLPICAWCRKVRDDHGYWNQLEQYIRDHSEADFSHGICPDCYAKHFPGRALSLEPEAK